MRSCSLIGESGKVNPIHCRMSVEQFGDGSRVGLLAVEPQRQRLHPTQQEIAVERRQSGAFAVLDEIQLLPQFFIVDYDGASHHIAVTAEKLRRRMQTMSAPSSSGRCRYGDMVLLSTHTSAPRRCAMSATARISMICSSGLVGVSR